MNPLLKLMGRNNGNTNILGVVMGAMMSGQSPQDFLRSQAANYPQLKDMDLNDLEGTAKKLCQQQGKNVDEVVGQAKNLINQ